MGRVKAQRHDRFRSLPNCFPDPLAQKGQWGNYFGNTNPLHIEPGCGKAELSLGLAQANPDINFLAIDLKSDRLCRGADLALAAGLTNLAFLRMNALALPETFLPQSVDQVWLTFPDPFPKDRDEKKRLTNPTFLEIFQRILKPGGEVLLKTDNDGLIAYTLEVLANHGVPVSDCSNNLHRESPLPEIARYLTAFEKKFLHRNKNIHYLRFKIPKSVFFFNNQSDSPESTPVQFQSDL